MARLWVAKKAPWLASVSMKVPVRSDESEIVWDAWTHPSDPEGTQMMGHTRGLVSSCISVDQSAQRSVWALPQDAYRCTVRVGFSQAVCHAKSTLNDRKSDMMYLLNLLCGTSIGLGSTDVFGAQQRSTTGGSRKRPRSSSATHEVDVYLKLQFCLHAKIPLGPNN